MNERKKNETKMFWKILIKAFFQEIQLQSWSMNSNEDNTQKIMWNFCYENRTIYVFVWNLYNCISNLYQTSCSYVCMCRKLVPILTFEYIRSAIVINRKLCNRIFFMIFLWKKFFFSVRKQNKKNLFTHTH